MTLRVPSSRLGPFGRVALFLFGLVFLGGGLAMGYFLLLSDLRTWIGARDFLPVQAEILHVELKTHRGKSTTYETKARYRYAVADRIYVSERVAIGAGADNIGSYQQDLYKKLNRARQQRTPVIAWANPSDPNEALLDREMRWGLFALKSMFFLIFTPIGLGLAVYSLRAPSESPTATNPLARPEWRDGRIASGSRAGVVGTWAMALLWNGISAPILFILPAEFAKQNWPALFGLLFPLAGLWLLYLAAHKTLQWRRFGTLLLVMNPFPAAVGGVVGGAIELPERFRSGQRFRVQLTCIHKRISGNRDRDVSQHAVWQNETTVSAETGSRGSRVSFRFHVPANLPPTEAPSDSHHYWNVRVHAALDGVDLDHTFEIPLAPAAAGAATYVTAPAAASVPAPEIPTNVIRIERRGSTTIFYYPLFRHLSLGVGLLVFSLISGGATIFLFSQAKGLTGLIAGFMALVFGTVTLGMALLALYCLANTLRVEISPHSLIATRRVFGIPFTTHVPLDEISAIETKIGSQGRNGNNFSIRYTLHALRHVGRQVTVGDDIPGQSLADHLAMLLQESCGLRR